MNQALEAQKKNPKKILIEFYTEWCGSCRLMERKTFEHPEISKYINENYYAVKFNAEGNEFVNFQGKEFSNPQYDSKKAKSRNSQHQFTRYMNISSYPSTIFIDFKGNLITGLVGYFEVRDVEPYLVLIATDEYRKVKTQEDWENYRSRFKSKIKK